MQTKHTNNAQSDLHLASFFSEALPYVDLRVHTEINSGGCGIFSKLLIEQLAKVGIEAVPVALFSGSRRQQTYENNFKHYLISKEITKNKSNTGVEHIMTRVGDLYVDSRGISNGQMYAQFPHRYDLTLDQLNDLIDRAGWNNEFDRSQIPDIELKLEEVFSKIKEFHTGMFPLDKAYKEYKKDNSREGMSLLEELEEMAR